MQGIDTTNVSVQMMQQASAQFACLYFGYFAGYDVNNINTKQGKVTTPTEVSALSQAGYYIVTNFEWFATRPLDGYDAGVWDANMCTRIHLACGGPPDAVFYHSYDYDTDGSNILEIGYIRGVASVIGLNRTGIYGPYRVVKNYFDKGLIKHAWQTYAWSTDNNGTLWDPRVNIEQYDNSHSLYDLDRSMTPLFGQWRKEFSTVFLEQAAITTWNSTANLNGGVPFSNPTEIFNAWMAKYVAGNDMPAPATGEFPINDWRGNIGVGQAFLGGIWAFSRNGITTFYKKWTP